MIRLKELRNQRNLTQETIAEYLGITRAAYSNIENEKRQCDVDTLLKLSNYYNVTVGYLLGVESVPRNIKNQPTAQGDELDVALFNSFLSLDPHVKQALITVFEALIAAHSNSSGQQGAREEIPSQK